MKKALLGLTIFGIGTGLAVNQYQKKEKKKSKKSRKKSRARKKKKKELFDIRSPFYETGDKIYGLLGKIPKTDKPFVKKGDALLKSFDDISSHLKANYIWD